MAPLRPSPFLLTLLLLAAASEDQDAPFHIAKCCLKRQRLDLDPFRCESPKGSPLEHPVYSEVLKPPIDADWLPEILRSRTVIAHYYPKETFDFSAMYLNSNSSIMEEFISIDASKRRFAQLENTVPPLDSRAVWKQTFCIDRSLHSSVSDIIITRYLLRRLKKCCPFGKRLTDNAQSCEAAENDNWLPATSLANASGIIHEVMGNRFFWNVAVPAAEDDDSRWRLMAPPLKSNLTAWVRGSVGRREVQGVAWRYCFDATAPGEFSPLVLLAAVSDVRKCCSRTQRLSADGQQCEAVVEGGEVNLNEEEQEMGFVGEEKLENSTWLPATLNYFLNVSDGVVTVMYNMHWELNLASVLVLDADVAGDWVMKFPADSPPEIWMRSGTLNKLHELRNWCFDTQATRGSVLMAEVPCDAPSVLCLPKCCPTGSMLTADGICHPRPANARDWDPNQSAAVNFLPRNRTLVAYYDLMTPCMDESFMIHTSDGWSAAHLLQEPHDKKTPFLYFYHCADMQLSDHGAPREVFAYCDAYPRGRVFLMVRQLQLLAVVFLAVGLSVILRDEDTRRSLHGCALACHTFCLLLSNTLQITWFLASHYYRTCFAFGELHAHKSGIA